MIALDGCYAVAGLKRKPAILADVAPALLNKPNLLSARWDDGIGALAQCSWLAAEMEMPSWQPAAAITLSPDFPSTKKVEKGAGEERSDGKLGKSEESRENSSDRRPRFAASRLCALCVRYRRGHLGGCSQASSTTRARRTHGKVAYFVNKNAGLFMELPLVRNDERHPARAL